VTADQEMSLKAWVGSLYFTGLYRLAVIVLTAIVLPLVGYAAWVLTDVRSQQLTTASDLAIVQEIQVVRAKDGESFQTEIRSDVTEALEAVAEVAETVDRLENSTITVSTDVKFIKDMLLRDPAIASRFSR
jgi:hypothetical protein